MLSFLTGTNIFNQHKNKDAIKNTIAVLMLYVVHADDKVTIQEQTKILHFYKKEFHMDKEQTDAFFHSLEVQNLNFTAIIDELKHALAQDQKAKAKVLEYLNNVIICDGCIDAEYKVFEQIKSFLV